jgi:hypothetical protein
MRQCRAPVHFTLNNERGLLPDESRKVAVVQAHTIVHFLDALALVGATVATHSAGSAAIVWCTIHYEARQRHNSGFVCHMVVQIVMIAVLIALHLLEIVWWGLFYQAHGSFANQSTAFYFSLITYATVGYGDVLLPREARAIGGVEALTGVLMTGWSVSIMVWVVSREYERRIAAWKNSRLRR